MEYNYDNNEKKSGGMGCLVGIIIFLTIVAAIVGIFYANVANSREKLLYPTLRKVGLFENLIPAEVTVEESPYAEYTTEDFINEIKAKEDEINQLKIDIKDRDKSITEKSDEITRLKVFEDEQLKFKQEKEAFDLYIAENSSAPSVSDYVTYYEQMYPENAAKIYEQFKKQVINEEELAQYIKTYESMDETRAAEILAEMSTADIDLVVAIFDGMRVSNRAVILENMANDKAARISKMLAPSNY